MKVLILNGSPRPKGNTRIALQEMMNIFDQEGVSYDYLQIGTKNIRGCIGCLKCRETGHCVFDDDVNKVAAKLDTYDGIVVGSPVYFGSANATVMAFMTRLFYSCSADLRMKVGVAVVCARRSGTVSSFDELNRFFTIRSMPIASASYWNNIHGRLAGEAEGDEEGKFTMRELAHNMIFLMRGIALAKEAYGLPETGKKPLTNFIR